MNGDPGRGRRRLLADALRWLVGLAVVVFLVRRLIRDWPLVEPSLANIDWRWLAIAGIVCIAYFVFRILAWQFLLGSVGVRGRTAVIARVWMNGEVVRYIPGNVWSVLGRIAQATHLGTTRTVVFASMVLEVLVLVASAAGLTAALLIPYLWQQFPGRSALLVLFAASSLLVLVPRFVQWAVHLVGRTLRRVDELAVVGRTSGAFLAMAGAWLTFTVTHLAVAKSLGVAIGGDQGFALASAFLASWLIGYLSFITPSGIGVREAALVWLIGPLIGAPTAILVAAVSRVAVTIIELIVLAVVNLRQPNR